MDFDEMESAQPDLLWANFTESGVRLEADEETVDEIDGALVGVIRKIEEESGEYDSRLYQINHPDYDSPIAFWGKQSINVQVDNANLQVGDEIGLKFTGETGETDNGTFDIFDVRYNKA